MDTNDFRIIFLLVCLTLFVQNIGVAQQKKKFNPLTDDITQILPPMDELLDSAYTHDGTLKFNQLQYLVNKGNLRTSQTLWTQNLGLQANIQYGTGYLYNNNNGNIVAGQTQQQTITTQQNETQYSIGGFYRLPLSDIVNRRNQVKISRNVVDQAQALIDSRKNEVRQLVIKQYNDIVTKQHVLKIKSQYLETTRINSQMAEKGFVKGSISLDDYARVSEIGTRTETDYETAKMDFINSYMIMEVMTGMNFHLSNEILQNNEGN
jgi:outer membrane protein TolC